MNLSFQDSTYSASNKPSAATLKADLQTIETDFNAHVADSTLHFLASTIWPVGSVYISVVATNPATLLGFGTWSAFAAGRTLVGIDAGQTEFDTVEETGGAKTNTTTFSATTSGIANFNFQTKGSPSYQDESSSNPDHNHTVSGTTGELNVLQPYIVTYMWKRTA